MSARTLRRPSMFFFFNDTATTEIYTLSLHDALPILRKDIEHIAGETRWRKQTLLFSATLEGDRKSGSAGMPRPISYAVFCLKKKKRTTADARWAVHGDARAGPEDLKHRDTPSPRRPR